MISLGEMKYHKDVCPDSVVTLFVIIDTCGETIYGFNGRFILKLLERLRYGEREREKKQTGWNLNR